MSVWTTRDGRKIPVAEMSDEHLRNTIAMLERAEMPEPHDFPGDSMAAYYADQDMNSAWEKYHHKQEWLEVLRREQQRRLNASEECPKKPASEPLPGHHWIAHKDAKDRWTIFKCARCGAERELKS